MAKRKVRLKQAGGKGRGGLAEISDHILKDPYLDGILRGGTASAAMADIDKVTGEIRNGDQLYDATVIVRPGKMESVRIRVFVEEEGEDDSGIYEHEISVTLGLIPTMSVGRCLGATVMRHGSPVGSVLTMGQAANVQSLVSIPPVVEYDETGFTPRKRKYDGKKG